MQVEEESQLTPTDGHIGGGCGHIGAWHWVQGQREGTEGTVLDEGGERDDRLCPECELDLMRGGAVNMVP